MVGIRAWCRGALGSCLLRSRIVGREGGLRDWGRQTKGRIEAVCRDSFQLILI